MQKYKNYITLLKQISKGQNNDPIYKSNHPWKVRYLSKIEKKTGVRTSNFRPNNIHHGLQHYVVSSIVLVLRNYLIT